MRKLLYLVLLATLFSCNEPGVKRDFVQSNWGDKYTVVKETYQSKKGFVASEDMISYELQSLKDTAKVMFLFSNEELISGEVKYHQKGDKETKKLYYAYVKKNRDKFGFETFSGNPKTYEYEVYEQRAWQNEKMLVSIRLDENQILIKYFDKNKMPKN